MLVLTRKLGQNIIIGDNISVKILRIDNNKVQLGISAPAQVAIYRQELIDKIKDFNQRASRTNREHLRIAAKLFRSWFSN